MSDRTDRRSTPMRLLGRALSWALMILALAVLAAVVVVPRIAGATPYTILTGSMSPDLSPGTLVVVRPVDAADVQVGTVLTYQLRPGRPAVVTHRVIGVSVDEQGERSFQTQGDANNTPDTELVRPVQVQGALWYHVPHLGHVNSLLTGAQHVWLLGATVAGLLLYAATQLAGAARDRRRARTIARRRPADVDAAREQVDA